jgi:hypothetical protein
MLLYVVTPLSGNLPSILLRLRLMARIAILVIVLPLLLHELRRPNILPHKAWLTLLLRKLFRVLLPLTRRERLKWLPHVGWGFLHWWPWGLLTGWWLRIALLPVGRRKPTLLLLERKLLTPWRKCCLTLMLQGTRS